MQRVERHRRCNPAGESRLSGTCDAPGCQVRQQAVQHRGPRQAGQKGVHRDHGQVVARQAVAAGPGILQPPRHRRQEPGAHLAT